MFIAFIDIYISAVNVQPYPVDFLMENQDFFNASRHKVPRNCTIDLENRNYNCTGKGRPYNYMEWMVTIKPSETDQQGE
jgi:hypothetical protein